MLDDPFAAVDGPVAQHMFEEGVRKLLHGHTVVLALSSQLELLEDAQHVVALERGTVVAQGSYSELVATGTHYSPCCLDAQTVPPPS